MIVQITPPAIANISWRVFIIFAILNALFIPIIYLFFPETMVCDVMYCFQFFSDGNSGRVSSWKTSIISLRKVELREAYGELRVVERFKEVYIQRSSSDPQKKKALRNSGKRKIARQLL